MVASLSGLEWSFIAVVGIMSLLAGIFAVYAFIQIFRNPSRG
ncbi:MAG: hypothetical protein ACRDH9_06015 [Actinomycetota bacterium]